MQDRAPQTVKKYLNTFQQWKKWAKRKGLHALPASGYEFALYIAYLLRKAKSVSTIHAAVYGVAWAHKKVAAVSPTEHPLVKQMVEAAKRIIGTAPKNRKQPLGIDHIKKLVRKFGGGGDLSKLQITCLITLGYSGFLRWDDLAKLRRQDVLFYEDHMRIFLQKRKNDQYREGSWIFIARTGNCTCPVKLMEEFFRQGKHKPSDWVFRKVSHTVNGLSLRSQAMTYSRAKELFSKELKGLGLDPSKYGLHSLRSGGTTEAAAWGVPDRLIQRHVSGNKKCTFTRIKKLRTVNSVG
jgi:integrase